jgi:hypothetical protein
MTDTETDFDDAPSETKPRKSRKRNEERRVFYYQTINGKPKELGSFPETAIGTLSERNIISFAKDFFREGDIRAEIRKSNGHFERSFDFSIAETEKPIQTIIDIEPEEFEDDAPEEFSFEASDQTNALQLQLLIEKEKTKRLETELNAAKAGSQNETQASISALERAHEKNSELMMMLLTNAQKPQPHQDPTQMMLQMLQGTLAVQKGVRELSEEIAPNDSGGGGSTMLGDASKLINAIGQNAPTFIPLIGGMFGGGATKAPTRANKTQTAPTGNGNAQNGGGLANLAKKIQEKENTKNER